MTPARQHSKRVIILLIIAVLILAGAALGAAWLLGWFNPAPKISVINIGTPGAATGDAADLRLDEEKADDLIERMNKLLKSNDTGLFASTFRLAGPFGEPAAVLSEIYRSGDQLLYGQYLLEQKQQKAFFDWWNDFAATCLTTDGLVRAQAGMTDDQVVVDADFWRVNLATLRLLAQSCKQWPDVTLQDSMRRLSDRLLTLGSKRFAADYTATIPTPQPSPIFEATPTPKPTTTPAATEAGDSLPVLRLASLDLYTMQQLAAFDNRWQALFDRALLIVQNGYISDDLPLFALAYVEDQTVPGYLNFDGDAPVINTEEALLTLLHLCEIGQENPRSISWLRDQMFNEHAIFESYHIVQGQATSSQECLQGYAIIARIARIEGDSDLYQAAINRLLWHQATSPSSDALSAIFREDNQKLISILASDNAWALLAMR